MKGAAKGAAGGATVGAIAGDAGEGAAIGATTTVSSGLLLSFVFDRPADKVQQA